ncbi:unnamed protein product [Gadus morhua 'NCC']
MVQLVANSLEVFLRLQRRVTLKITSLLQKASQSASVVGGLDVSSVSVAWVRSQEHLASQTTILTQSCPRCWGVLSKITSLLQKASKSASVVGGLDVSSVSVGSEAKSI